MSSLTAKQLTSANGYRLGSTAITNQNQGGGDAKAGLVPMTNVPYTRPIALRVAQTRNTLPNLGNPLVAGLIYTVNPCVQQSRPVGSRPQFNTYFLTGNQCCSLRHKCHVMPLKAT